MSSTDADCRLNRPRLKSATKPNEGSRMDSARMPSLAVSITNSMPSQDSSVQASTTGAAMNLASRGGVAN